LGSDPSVPLAVTSAGKILDAHECCLPWARRGERWLAIDEWGAVVGVAEVSGGGGTEVTQCYSLELSRVEGVSGSGLHASRDFRGSPSFAWQPAAAERESLRRFLEHADALLDADGDPPPSWENRTRFFRTGPGESGSEHYAVFGGSGLVLARLERGRWIASFIDAELHTSGGSVPGDSYRLVAVFDMTSDGYPEIVFVRGGDAIWEEDILYRSSGGWQRARTGIGGSSI
jgi:hypothetical protein